MTGLAVKPLLYFLNITLVFISSGFINTYAAPDIRFSSYRFSLDTKNRQQSFTLTNRGSLTSRCTLGFIHNKVLEGGQLVRVKSAVQVANSASPYLRFSPKRVTISANASQTVRLALKRVKDQPKGEFVSYLRFSCVDDTRSAARELVVTPRINYNIPVVVRIGKLTSQGSISKIKLEKKVLSFDILHSGQRSLYGNIEVIDSDSGNIIARRNNLSIYVGVTTQRIELTLSTKPSGKIKIQFKEKPLNGNEIKFQASY